MSLRTIKSNDPVEMEHAARMLHEGAPLIVRFDERADAAGTSIKATLLMDALGTKRGTRVVIRQDPSLQHGPDQLREAILGSEHEPQARPGDIIAFSHSYANNGIAFVGRIGGRTHDGMLGKVQATLALARISQSKVSKRGATQHLTICVPSEARTIANLDQAEQFLKLAERKAMPGARIGAIMRTREKHAFEFDPTDENGIDFLLEELDHEQIFEDDGSKILFIPTMKFPVGRDQIKREIKPNVQTDGWVTGNVSSLYTPAKSRVPGFLPSIVITADEDEWAFGGKTGRRIRVAAGIQPIRYGNQVMPRDITVPTASGTQGVVPVSNLFSEAEMDAAASVRAKMRPEQQDPTPAPERRRSAAQEAPARPGLRGLR